MAWFNHLSYRIKLMLPLGLLAFLFIVMAYLSVVMLAGMRHIVDEIVVEDIQAIDDLLQTDRDLYQAVVAERSMIIADVESEDFKQLLDFHSESIRQAIERFDAFAATAKDSGLAEESGMLPLLEKYDQSLNEWIKLTNEVVTQRAENTRIGRSTAIDLSFKEAREAFETTREALNTITETLLEHIHITQQETTESVQASTNKLLILAVAAASICVLLAYVLPIYLTRPMRHLIGHINNIAEGEGDLTARLEVESRDEMGQLAAAFNHFISNLQTIISQAKDASNQVLTSSTRISGSSLQVSEIVKRQRNETEQVAAAISEMAASILEVAHSASKAAGATEQADEQANQGLGVVTQTVEAITMLADDVERSAEVINRLKGESENIGNVLVVIRGIAEQTNLLALNAAIEAARAGEQGRGFAVVADEVRTLAQRSQQSTREIENMIDAIQAGTNEAKSVMTESQERARSTVEQAAHAGHSLEAISQSVAVIRDMNAQIAAASEQQSATASELERNITNIQQVSEESEQQSTDMLHASEELDQVGKQLQNAIGRFSV